MHTTLPTRLTKMKMQKYHYTNLQFGFFPFLSVSFILESQPNISDDYLLQEEKEIPAGQHSYDVSPSI